MKVSGQRGLAQGWGRRCCHTPAPANPILSEVRMATVSHPRPRVKPARTCRLLDVGPGHRLLSVVQGTGEQAAQTHYHLSEVACDFGRGFELRKLVTDGGETYSVHLDSTGDSCTCLGHLRWGHKTVCKHIGAVKAL